MRLASRTLGGTALAAVGLLGLAGCVTTQEKNSWTLLVNARTLAAEKAVRVTRADPDVRVLRVQLVGHGRSAAVVVELRNLIARPLSDLPISVGTSSGKERPRYLNDKPNIDYYDAHVPAIAPNASTIWVLPGIDGSPAKGRLFAIVGAPRAPASTTTPTLPRIDASTLGSSVTPRMRVALSNTSGLPQFGLQLYAVAIRDGRYVAAARAAVPTLNGNSTTTVGVRLIGSPAQANVELYAPATIFK